MNNSFQTHSATSRAAAFRSEMNQLSDCDKIEQILIINKEKGMTGDEAAIACNISPGTASARMRNLQESGRAKKSMDMRLTRSGHPANVWKLPEYVLIEADKKRNKAKEALSFIDNFIKNESPTVHEKNLLLKLREIVA